MKKTLFTGLVLTLVSVGVQAQDANRATPSSNITINGGWKGSGEFGYASARGNSRTENINGKLNLSQENTYWKNNFSLTGLRSKGETTVTDENGQTVNKLVTTANRYTAAASIGYRLDARSYIVNALRYDHDEFSANLWQGTLSIGYGYIAIKTEQTEFSFEIGPGFKRYRPADEVIQMNGVDTKIKQNTQSELVGRSLINYKYQLTANTALDDSLLVEAGSKNNYYQNDLGLSVKMSKKMALKIGYQIRYNSNILPGVRHMDTLTTTNLVYNF